jgi:CRISPR/Cas system CMR subunit Cmr4 (Cas7 group RAMP superfamily)
MAVSDGEYSYSESQIRGMTLARSGKSAEEVCRAVLTVSDNAFEASVVLRDAFGMGLAECLAVVERVRRERENKAASE